MLQIACWGLETRTTEAAELPVSAWKKSRANKRAEEWGQSLMPELQSQALELTPHSLPEPHFPHQLSGNSSQIDHKNLGAKKHAFALANNVWLS